MPSSPTHHCPGCHNWSNASSGAAWSAASDPTDGRFTHAISTDRGFRTLAEAAPGHGLLYAADAVGGRSQTAHRIAIERLAHARAVPTTALAVVTELFRDWATPLAGPARDVLDWYFNEVPKHTDQVGVAEAEKPAAAAAGPPEMSGRLVRKLCIVTDTD